MYKDRPTAAGSLITLSVKGGDAHGVSRQGRNLPFPISNSNTPSRPLSWYAPYSLGRSPSI